MAVSLPRLLLLFLSIFSVSSLGRFCYASSLCPRVDELALLESTVRSQCPSWIKRSPVLEVSGETLDKELGHGRRNAYYSVLFYASWCPFSQTTRQLFDALNVLFPGIQHFAVEESSALPSVFSRYGVHSFPSILIMNGTTRVRYRGSKDLISLLLFYMKTTGLEPVTYFPGDHPFDIRAQKRTAREMLRREPYLALSLLFLFFKAFVYVSPQIWSQVKALWLSYVWQANWAAIFRGGATFSSGLFMRST